jgi:hypothetical protein
MPLYEQQKSKNEEGPASMKLGGISAVCLCNLNDGDEAADLDAAMQRLAPFTY